MARRRYQRGYVFKRGVKRKVWVARWREQVLAEGGGLKCILRSEILGTAAEIPTKKEACGLLEQRLRTVNGAAPRADSTILFSDFVENRWRPAMLCTYKPSTRGQYELALKNYLCPAFGGSKLREIDKAGIQAFFGKLLQRLSPDTVHGIHRVLQRVLSSAIEWNYILSNPAKGIKLPPCRRREPPFIRREQFQALLRALPELVRTMVHMAMMTSMRIGEILALRWGRLDLERGVIRIEESYYRGHFSSVKSQRSQRQVPLSLSLLLALRERYEKASPQLDDLVFAARNGRPLRDGNILRRFIYPTCDQLRIPRISWHALRHLHGTLLSQLGVPVAVAQAQLGHSNPRITLSIYTHVLPGAQRDAVDRLERYLFPNVPKIAQSLCNKEPAEPG